MDAEEKPQVDGAAGKVANKMAGDDRPAIDLVERNRLARIGVSSRRACLPGRDGRAAAMGLAFVLHDSVLGKTARNRFAIRSIGGEIGGYEIGRASGRERVCKDVSISGVAVSLKKKQRNK